MFWHRKTIEGKPRKPEKYQSKKSKRDFKVGGTLMLQKGLRQIRSYRVLKIDVFDQLFFGLVLLVRKLLTHRRRRGRSLLFLLLENFEF